MRGLLRRGTSFNPVRAPVLEYLGVVLRWLFPQIGGPFLECPGNKIPTSLEYALGLLIVGISHVDDVGIVLEWV